MEKKLNILLAEDDENLGQLLLTYLQGKGYSVNLARNGNSSPKSVHIHAGTTGLIEPTNVYSILVVLDFSE